MDTAENFLSISPVVFYLAVMAIALTELLLPGRGQTADINRRWLANFGLFGLGLALQRLLAPISALTVAHIAANNGVRLLHHVTLPAMATVCLGILLLDFWKYLEHWLVHKVPLLWRLHLTHHTDVDVDFTTTERHHPLEHLFGVGTLALIVYCFAVPPLAMALYVSIASVISLLAHANLRLPAAVDGALRSLVVTPAVHVIHHSADRRETDSNFGMALTLWDRLFGTYRAPDEATAQNRTLGLEYFRDDRCARLDGVLCLPFLPIPTPLQPVASAAPKQRST